MKYELKTQIDIQAPAAKVWEALTDFASYPNWNPFIKNLSGTVEPGQNICLRLEPPGAKGMTFKPTVLDFKTNTLFRWQGHLWIKGLFDGLHAFEIIDHGNGTCTFIQSEGFGGLLVGLFKNMIDNQTRKGFEMMNEALKKRAEIDLITLSNQ
ncbi:MAG: SRPBCC domain-containing protein [Chitinophagaceae bacterium]|nr:SRPBCC domain-containing protein [Chitinophagaceae bacterium]